MRTDQLPTMKKADSPPKPRLMVKRAACVIARVAPRGNSSFERPIVHYRFYSTDSTSMLILTRHVRSNYV
jgi:hypothetical protein